MGKRYGWGIHHDAQPALDSVGSHQLHVY
ncbi:hypothetical protein K1X09_12445 [Paenibacillus lautus]|nr:hypothetical protein [Paenibacillus lautus]